MVVFGRDKLASFTRKHADARRWIAAWLIEVEDASWKRMADVKRRYPKASILSDNRVVFDVKGNRYRMLTQISFDFGRVAVLRIGTHADYDEWDL
jgi:mRNA interferase HigB